MAHPPTSTPAVGPSAAGASLAGAPVTGAPAASSSPAGVSAAGPSSGARRRGRFVVLEGGEGSGKSTQAARLAQRWRDRGDRVVVTREPGGSPGAEHIRDLVLGARGAGLDARAEFLLFAAARADHVASLVGPALESGAHVVCDRFIDSSIAYQGGGRGLPSTELAEISRWACGGILPDLTVLLDLDPALGLARARDRNRLEAEGLGFHQEVRNMYLKLAAADPADHVVVSADGSPDQVTDRIWESVRARVPARARADADPGDDAAVGSGAVPGRGGP